MLDTEGYCVSEKEEILFDIEQLKREKPDGWKRSVRNLLKRIAYLEDPFGQHEWIGTENLNRTHAVEYLPAFDRMDEESDP